MANRWDLQWGIDSSAGTASYVVDSGSEKRLKSELAEKVTDMAAHGWNVIESDDLSAAFRSFDTTITYRICEVVA